MTVKSRIYLKSLLILLFCLSLAISGCKFYEFTKKVVYKEGDIDSRLEAIIVSPSGVIELKEGKQTDYSLVIVAGDDAENRQVKGFFIFDIKELYGHEILRASINISGAHTKSKPFFGEKVIVEAVDSIDFNCKGEYIADFPVDNYLDFFILNDNLKNTIMEAIENKRNRYYLRFQLANPTNNDNVEDLVIINLHDAYLKAEFLE